MSSLYCQTLCSGLLGTQKYTSDANSLEGGIMKKDIFRLDIHDEAAHYWDIQNTNGFVLPGCVSNKP